MDGAIFFRKSEIETVKELGDLPEDLKERIRQEVLDTRRRAIEARERQLKEALAQFTVGTKDGETVPDLRPVGPVTVFGAEGAPGAGAEVPPAGAVPGPVAPAAGPETGGSKAPAAGTGAAAGPEEEAANAAARRKRGEELLSLYPPANWTPKRAEDIRWRIRAANVPADAEEEVFLKEYDVWFEALQRLQAKEQDAGPGKKAEASAPASAPPDASTIAPR
jgi:hypothetical protein